MQIGKKYWHPEFGWVTYEGMDRSIGMYHVIKVLSDGEYTTLDSTTLLYEKKPSIHDRREYTKYKKQHGSTVQTGRF